MAISAFFVTVFVAVLTRQTQCSPLELTEDTFQSTLDSGNPVFIKFYAPWCGHCKNLAPTWNQLADQYAGTNMIIAKVDCTSQTKTCADNQVKSYPTLKLFSTGSIWDHRGARDLQTLSDFVTSHIGEAEKQSTQPVTLTDESFQKFITATPGLHFVKFYAPWCGHCQRLAPVWEELAQHYQDQPTVHISKIDCTKEINTCGQMEVKGYPTLLLFVNGVMVEKYSGARDFSSLIHFLNEAAARESPEVHGVLELTGESFTSALKENEVLFVKFYAPWCGHCKHLAPTWEQLGEAVHSSSTSTIIAKVDCTVEKALCSEQGVHGYPTLVLFSKGQRNEYRGARDFNSLLKYMQDNS